MKKVLQKNLIITSLLVFSCWHVTKSQIIAAGGYHSVFLCSDNKPMVCGGNTYGELGDGTVIFKPTPIPVNSLTGITAVTAATYRSLFLKNDGTVWGCGANSGGQLGDGSIFDKTIPVKAASLSGIVAISAGDMHSLFLKNDSTVWACGYNGDGQLGNGVTDFTPHPTPAKINSLAGIISIEAGGWVTQGFHSLFLKKDGTVWACGDNTYGQLGDGTTIDKYTPIQIPSLTGIKAIAAGGIHSLFLKNDGTVWACGYNFNGQLGIGSNAATSIPVQINSLSSIKSISAGYVHSLFLKNDGTVYSCGDNFNGTLGDGTNIGKNTPIQITSITNVSSVDANGSHSLFSKNDGTFWACGRNASGQLGDGTGLSQNLPIQIINACNSTGIIELFSKDEISVYPNPNNGKFKISTSDISSTMAIEIYNVVGKKLFFKEFTNEKNIDIDAADFSNGIYFVKVYKNNTTSITKLLKQ